VPKNNRFFASKKGRRIEIPPARVRLNCAQIVPVKVKFFQTLTNKNKNKKKKYF
jgi:hypothetical protein